MDVFTMVVLIVLISTAATVANKYVGQRSKWKQDLAERDGRLAHLEERVRALEAIVTDHGYELKREFRQLERG